MTDITLRNDNRMGIYIVKELSLDTHFNAHLGVFLGICIGFCIVLQMGD